MDEEYLKRLLANPAQTEIYNHFQYGTSYRGDGDGDGWACE